MREINIGVREHWLKFNKIFIVPISNIIFIWITDDKAISIRIPEVMEDIATGP